MSSEAKIDIIKGSNVVNRLEYGSKLVNKGELAGVNINQNRFIQTKGMPTLVSGKLEPRANNNPLKCSLLISNKELDTFINSIDEGFVVHALHLARITVSGSKNGRNQLSRYFTAKTVKVTAQNKDGLKFRTKSDPLNAEPDWDKEKYPVPLVGHLIGKAEVVVGHMLIMNYLTINQTATLILKAPKFVLQSCCYLDASGTPRPIKDINTMFKVYLLKKIQHYNNLMRYNAMSVDQRKQLRDQIQAAKGMAPESGIKRIAGVIVECEQFQIDMKSEEIIEGISSGSTSNSVVGRIGLSTSQNSNVVEALDFKGTPEEPVITVIKSVAAKPFSSDEFYSKMPHQPPGTDDFSKEDFVWVNNNFTSFGSYNWMVKPVWMDGVDLAGIFEEITLDEVKVEFNKFKKQKEVEIVQKISNDANLAKIAQGLKDDEPDSIQYKNKLVNEESKKWDNYWKIDYLNYLIERSDGQLKSNNKIQIPKFNMFDIQEIKKFNDKMKEEIDKKKDEIGLDLKINNTLITKEKLMNIWQSINVLHRTVKARIRSFKI